MNTIHLTELGTIPLTDIKLCSSPAQVVYLLDTMAKRLVDRLGQQILNGGMVMSTENMKENRHELSASLHIIPLHYGNDVLSFARDVVAAHEANEKDSKATG